MASKRLEAGRSPFVGREREMTILRDIFGLTQNGTGSVALILGEAGIGKTRLITEFADWASQKGSSILRTTCYEGETTQPFGPWIDAIRKHSAFVGSEILQDQLSGVNVIITELIPEFHALFPGEESPAPVSPADARATLFSAIRRFIQNCANLQPMAIAIDNLQWADRESLRLLLHVAVDLAQSPVMIIGSCRESAIERSASLSNILPDLAKVEGFHRVHPRELMVEDVKAFVSQMTAGAEVPVDADGIYHRSQGNPFFMSELVREYTDSPRGIQQPSSIPITIRETLKRHIELTGAYTQKILSSAAVIGRWFTLSDLALLHPDLPKPNLLEHIQSAQEIGIIAADDSLTDSFRFDHVLFLEYLVKQIPVSAQTSLHRTLAKSLIDNYGDQRGPHILAIFHHLSEAAPTEPMTNFLAITLEAASYAFQIHALEEALAIIDTGLSIRNSDSAEDSKMARINQLKGVVLYELGDPSGKEFLVYAFNGFELQCDYNRAVECAISPVVTSLYLGGNEYWQVNAPGNTELVRRALAFTALDSLQRNSLLLSSQTSEAVTQNLPGELLEKVADSISGTDSPVLESYARVELGRWYFSIGQHDKFRAEEMRTVPIMAKVEEPWIRRLFSFWKTSHSLVLGELDQARVAVQAARDFAVRSGGGESTSTSLYLASQVNYVSGNWMKSIANVQEILDLRRGSPRSLYNEYAVAVLMAVAYEKADRDAGDTFRDQLLSIGGETRTPFLFLAPGLSRVTGEIDEAERLAYDLRAIPCNWETKFNWSDMYRQVALAQLAPYLSNTKTITEMVNWFLPLKGFFMPAAFFGRSTDSLLGSLYKTLGMPNESIAHYNDAIKFCRKGYLPELAWTSWEYACVLAGRNARNDKDLALTVLNEGSAIATRLGIVPLLAKMDALKDSMGGAPQKLPDSMTPREAEVLLLITRGFTNQGIAEKLFISPRTVAQHVRNIFHKTGMANRAEVTSYAFRNGLAE
jgi:DNA-binding CsgD family transcriptional regulator